jgi:hypothetical protein
MADNSQRGCLYIGLIFILAVGYSTWSVREDIKQARIGKAQREEQRKADLVRQLDFAAAHKASWMMDVNERTGLGLDKYPEFKAGSRVAFELFDFDVNRDSSGLVLTGDTVIFDPEVSLRGSMGEMLVDVVRQAKSVNRSLWVVVAVAEVVIQKDGSSDELVVKGEVLAVR